MRCAACGKKRHLGQEDYCHWILQSVRQALHSLDTEDLILVQDLQASLSAAISQSDEPVGAVTMIAFQEIVTTISLEDEVFQDLHQNRPELIKLAFAKAALHVFQHCAPNAW